jgi:hypothetical protein
MQINHLATLYIHIAFTEEKRIIKYVLHSSVIFKQLPKVTQWAKIRPIWSPCSRLNSFFMPPVQIDLQIRALPHVLFHR